MSLIEKGLHLKQKIKLFYNIENDVLTLNGKLKQSLPVKIRKIALSFSKKEHKNYSASKLLAIITITSVLTKLLKIYVKKYNKSYFEQASKIMQNYFAEKDFENLKKLYFETFCANSLNEEQIIANLLMLYVTNLNPAFNCWLKLFNDDILCDKTIYLQFQKKLSDFDRTQGEFLEGSLIQTLIAPAIAHPNSLEKQLEYLLYHFGSLLDDELKNILAVSDLLKEEQKVNLGGAGPNISYDFTENQHYWHEPEAFSPDSHWMPNVVLLAKSTYIWLNQLSQKYKRPILRLNEIPDEELKLIADRGFNCLWLIGIWERSEISKKIKHRCGSYDAIASAYSLKRYEIATDLGAEEAYSALKQKANYYGLKLACDMVPNHMGLDSDWLKYHPEWFIQADNSPFPAYTFNSENLSNDPSIDIRIEDHYYNQSDAAVVFKYTNYANGQTRYIYHGNDGTSFPWNDTAQLNYLLPEVKKHVISEIINIAHKFKVIRFDAAMTLAKKHYQRLWFPPLGKGGDIPSRSEFSMPERDFRNAFGKEFWREVVDEVAEKAPDTLLLAEAFWMMEGYFVRSLGMHRVYNSAFMNMLKDEDNGKYRQSILNIIEFNPEILKRFVNFMNNPDEEPAIVQFGDSDKYFGVCTLMCTMPGLPMFGHGQIEGFYERYGMEYHSSKWNEEPNHDLINRHKRQIFPLLQNRYMFSGVKNFRLLNFVDDSGYVNHDVFCYSNIEHGKKSLVIYNNRYHSCSGKIAQSNEFYAGSWHTKAITDALQLPNNPNAFIVITDFTTGLKYIRNAFELCNHGFNISLQGYECHVFVGFDVIYDDENNHILNLAKYLQGGGVLDIEKAKNKVKLLPFIKSLNNLINPDRFNSLVFLRENFNQQLFNEVRPELKKSILACLNQLSGIVNGTREEEIAARIINDIQHWISSFAEENINPKKGEFNKAKQFYEKLNSIFKSYSRTVLAWIIIRRFGELTSYENRIINSINWYERYYIKDSIFDAFNDMLPTEELNANLELLKLMLATQDFWKTICEESLHDSVKLLFEEKEVQNYLKFNEFNNIVWFNKERFDDFIALVYLTNFIVIFSKHTYSNVKIRNCIIKLYQKMLSFSRKGEEAGYKLEELFRVL